MPLKITARTVEGIAVLDCAGRIVFGDECFELRDTVKGMLEKSPNLVLNLREVTYVDSGGLGTLVGLYTSARNANGNLKLAALNQRVTELLKVTKLLTVFESFPNEIDAVKSFATASSAA
jgi:anti-sigma B factor antagonist